MRLFGVDVKLGRGVDREKEINTIQLNDAKFGNVRTQLDLMQVTSTDDVKVPWYPLHPRTLYDIAVYSDTLRTIFGAIKSEIFRNGYEITEKFANKCTECKKEFEHPVDKCDECGSTDLKEPDVGQRKALEKRLLSVNDNEQDIITVCKEIEDDFQIIDDGYMLLTKDYYFDNDGKVVGNVPIEILRVHPMFIKMIADDTGRPGRLQNGEIVRTCLIHRDQAYSNNEQVCPKCGKQLYIAYYKANMLAQASENYIYYVKNEVFHSSKYKPSLTYGFSRIYAIWMKVVTLMNMDNYIKNYYAKQRPPRGLLFVRTPNMDSLEKAWNWMLDTFKTNPHMIPPISVESQDGGGNFVQFIDFMRSLDEMQFTESREEFRRTIGAVFGVMPLFQADITTSGGLNQEGLQITVTNRAIENGQKQYNEGFFPWLLREMDITDYVLTLLPSEEKDEMADEQLKAQKIQNARLMQAMGYDITLNEDNEFEFEPTEVPVEAPLQDTMPGGIPPLNEGSPQRFTGEPDDVSRSDSPVTSSTQGVNNPRHGTTRRPLTELIERSLTKILKEEDKTLSIKKQGEGKKEMVDFIMQGLFKDKFQNISKRDSDLIKEYIVRALNKGYSVKRITRYIKSKAGKLVTLNAAEAIARTETQALQNKIREWGYKKVDPEGKLKYKWLNVLDNRTTETCKNIVTRTRKGVSLDKLRQIINEEAKAQGHTPREFTPHINCRSTFVRSFK